MSTNNTIDINGDSTVFQSIINKTITEIFDDQIRNIGMYAFYSCTSLTTVSFPSAISIRDYAFAYCSRLTTISFPTVTSIGASAFFSCTSLTTASFPVASFIGSNAFYGCASLTTVSFPSAISIRYYAFAYCSSLTTAIFGNQSSVATAGVSIFLSTNSTIIYVPDNLVESYKTATNWSQYASRIKGISELPA